MTLPRAKSRYIWDSERETSVYLPADVYDFALLRRLPRLHTLHLDGGDGARISIASPSLRVIDLSRSGFASGKHCFIHSVACPMLTDLYVRSSGYGTGIRRVVGLELNWDEGSRVTGGRWEANVWSEIPYYFTVPAAGNTWVAPHHEDLPHRESDRYRIISLPAACTVHFE